MQRVGSMFQLFSSKPDSGRIALFPEVTHAKLLEEYCRKFACRLPTLLAYLWEVSISNIS